MRRARKTYYVYIMTNRSYTTLNTGVTNNIERRVYEHKHQPTGFAAKYRTSLLVYVEAGPDVWLALAREKQFKNLHRADKIALIESLNPNWYDLSEVMPQPRKTLPATG